MSPGIFLQLFVSLAPAMQVSAAASPNSEPILVSAIRGSPHPGSEAAVRRLISSLLRGEPDEAIMTPALADAWFAQLREAEHLLFPLGALRSVTFARNSPLGGDEYLVSFDRGDVVVDVALNSNGKLFASVIRPAGPPPG